MDYPDIQLLSGNPEAFQKAWKACGEIPVDDVWTAPAGWTPPRFGRTIRQEAQVSGPATYSRGKTRSLRFLPSTASDGDGWLFRRTDLPEQLPVAATLGNVAQADRAIVLRAGSDVNRVRMSEHIICHRFGLGLDNLVVELSSEDPPLFDDGSWPIVEALQKAGVVEDISRPLRYLAPKKPVALMRPSLDGFLMWMPAEAGERKLSMDVAIDFPTAIGRERIQLDLCEEAFCHGAIARTNCSASEMRLARSIGMLFARYRNLGYTRKNILLADKDHYVNEPKLCLPSGKALEAVWHRTCLDLVAALSLLPPGTRPAGKIVSYKSGHVLDVRFLTMLLIHDSLVEVC